MSEYITLMGSEAVARAGGQISSAASDMMRAAGQIDSTMNNHQVFLDAWLSRFKESKRVKFELDGIVTEGEFMGFGTDFEELRDGVGQYTTVIIKLDSGNLTERPTNAVTFI